MISLKPAFGPTRPINEAAVFTGLSLIANSKIDPNANYELVIGKLQHFEGLVKHNQSDKDTYHYLSGFCYTIIHHILCLYQQVSFEVLYPQNKKWFAHFDSLLSEDKSWIFSLNHDLYVECLALDLSLPFSYGDNDSISFPISNIDRGNIIEFGAKRQMSCFRNSTAGQKRNFGLHNFNRRC